MEDKNEVMLSIPNDMREVGQSRPSLGSNVYTLRQIYTIAALQCTKSEICAALGMSQARFKEAMKQDPDIAHIIEMAQNNGKMSLRRAQFTNAVDRNNSAMQKWLGQNYLGQTEKQETVVTLDDRRAHIDLTLTPTADKTIPQIEYDGTPPADENKPVEGELL